MKAKPKSKAAPRQRSLVDFMLAKRREGCPICELSADVKEQIIAARKKAIRRADVIEWLQAEYGLKLTPAQFDQHHSGKHEQ